eukprot:3563154-Amphidinium_carterae.1
MAALRVPDVAELRPTPGSLRGSGATFFYMCTEDISRLQWRGRWRRLATLEYYLQEAAVQSYL